MLYTKTMLVACAASVLFASAANAEKTADKNDGESGRQAAAQDDSYRRGYSAGFAAAMNRMRRRKPAVASRRSPPYVSEYTPYSPYAAENRPRVSMPSSVSAARPRTNLRGRYEFDDYVNYPGVADVHRNRSNDLPPRGRRYAPGDFRDEQGGIYGNRGVLMWTDRYDAGDYANKFWNTYRDNVYAGMKVWDWNTGNP